MRSVAVGLSVVLHLGLILGMSALPDQKSVAAPKLVEMKVVRPPPPPPPPPPPEEKKEEIKPPPEVKPKLVKKRTVEKIIPDEPAPPPKQEERPPPPPPAGFSVDMSSTVVAGGVAVPAVEGGGNMFADPKDQAPPGKKVVERPPDPPGKGTGKAPPASYQVTKMPEFIGDARDRTPPYPESAKEREIEGEVLLKVFVGKTGRVEDVRLIRRLDPECDAVAVKFARERFRFKPALAGDEPVAVWIDVPVRFEIER